MEIRSYINVVKCSMNSNELATAVKFDKVIGFMLEYEQGRRN